MLWPRLSWDRWDSERASEGCSDGEGSGGVVAGAGLRWSVCLAMAISCDRLVLAGSEPPFDDRPECLGGGWALARLEHFRYPESCGVPGETGNTGGSSVTGAMVRRPTRGVALDGPLGVPPSAAVSLDVASGPQGPRLNPFGAKWGSRWYGRCDVEGALLGSRTALAARGA